MILIKNAKIYTMASEIIENGEVKEKFSVNQIAKRRKKFKGSESKK